MSRCYNKKATGYHSYGGRGITVCDRWRKSFYSFLEDMGPRPYNTSLDRIDPNGSYCLENCRWASSKEQCNNKTDHYYLEYQGNTLNLSQWGEQLSILPNTIYYRLVRGWSPEEALEKIQRKEPWRGRLSREQVEYVLSEVAKGKTQTALGKELKIHSSQISRICSRANNQRN